MKGHPHLGSSFGNTSIACRSLEYNKSRFDDDKSVQQAITQTYLLFQMLFVDSIASPIEYWPLFQTNIAQMRLVMP
jgi:hypothetical protein